MAVVEISINGRAYNVTCDDGQEERLTSLAREVDARVSDLAGRIGQIGDARLMLLASLTLADELSDAKARAAGPATPNADEAHAALEAAEEKEGAALRVIEAASRRIRALADALEDDDDASGEAAEN
ncbi:MAG: cell division protein ZapA [Pseudomonadota bacterium]